MTERITKGNSMLTISIVPSNTMFLAAFLVRSSFMPFAAILSSVMTGLPGGTPFPGRAAYQPFSSFLYSSSVCAVISFQVYLEAITFRASPRCASAFSG